MGVEIFEIKKAITTAQVLTLNSSPITIVSAPGANKTTKVIKATVELTYNSIAYATNTVLQIEHAGSNKVMNQLDMLAAANDHFSDIPDVNSAPGDDQLVENAAIQATVQTGNPTTGNSPINIYVTYIILDTT